MNWIGSVFLVIAAFLAQPSQLFSETKSTTTSPGNWSPRKNWRLIPRKVTASDCQSAIQSAMKAGCDATLQTDDSVSAWIALELPERKNPAMFTFYPDFGLCHAVADVSADSTDGQNGSWQKISEQTVKRLAKIDLPPCSTRQWLRVSFTPTDAKPAKKIILGDLGLYSIDPAGGNDYWLCLGASIQDQSIRNRVFKKLIAEKFGYDPVIFNEAVSGWTTQNLLKALPGLLKKYPHARYVTVHIGGNNISGHRPYPGGAEELEKDLIAILEMIRDDGRIPIPARISYRAYKGKYPVPPEENGSGPYLEIYDRLIKKYSPAFFDAKTGKGKVDAYGWFKDHPEELCGDGIHVNPKGEFRWNWLWVENAGPVIYCSAQDPR